ncbi:UNVERIFIED_CONTAM: hypothetical protein K2H54_048427 [Gekko kuhli]
MEGIMGEIPSGQRGRQFSPVLPSCSPLPVFPLHVVPGWPWLPSITSRGVSDCKGKGEARKSYSDAICGNLRVVCADSFLQIIGRSHTGEIIHINTTLTPLNSTLTPQKVELKWC